MAYTIKELTGLLHKTEKTIERWMGAGLLIVPGGKKPILILGDDLIEFLKNKDEKNKVKLKRSEFFCMGCKAPRRAKRGSLKILSDRKEGECDVCSGKMSKLIKSRRQVLSNIENTDVNVGFEEPTPSPLL
jgi:hypothetical protein